MNAVLWAFVALLLARTLFQLLLEELNRRSVLAHAHEVPPAFREVMDAPTYQRSVDYTLAKNRAEVVSTLYHATVLAVVILTGLLPFLWQTLEGWLGTAIWAEASILIILGLVLGLPGLPLEYDDQFRIEERFGFNKMTVGLWITDKIKGLLVGIALGLPLLMLILWLVRQMGAWWWLWAFGVFLAFQIVMLVLYPMVIMPLFNKFEELPEGDLRRRLFELAERTGFRARTILVMDGSKRSAHSNAFFTGFGRLRRIVLFDTLVQQLPERQLEAVLAHEIGHYKLGHIPRMMLLSTVTSLLSFALIGWLAASPWFVESFGFSYQEGRVAPALFLFGILGGLVTYWLSPLATRLSRRHEYQADAFARQALEGDPQPLIGALRALSEKNLTNLTPHPFYSAFYYSHPTLLEREAALRGA